MDNYNNHNNHNHNNHNNHSHRNHNGNHLRDKIQYADDDRESVGLLFRLRIFSLAFGLLLGMILSFMMSQFEEVLSQNVSVVFFVPFVVYLASAVGNQTQAIYTRDLKTGRASFGKYLAKESTLGILFGIVFAAITFPIVSLWFGSVPLAMSVSLSLFAAVSLAPLIALIITEILQLERTDPAAGAGPIITVIQDITSVLIYGFIASAIIL